MCLLKKPICINIYLLDILKYIFDNESSRMEAIILFVTVCVGVCLYLCYVLVCMYVLMYNYIYVLFVCRV